VNQHLVAARDRARAGTGYLIHLPLGEGERWSGGLEDYWKRAGDRVGETVGAAAAPRTAGSVKVRAVRVRPEVVLSVVPRDLNIVLERLEPLVDEQRFDLVIATNVFVYYDSFEQALALVNIGRMLRPGATLLSNQAVQPVPPLGPAVGHAAVTFSDRQFDYVFWYRRQ
jgi:SAM-dependent methyltransferase